ncbi:MAG: ABC transporter substrate-binding protein, partial [Lachnospiraceae bacterium]|nr:ABC transporter substrate-binding protein [Lachnospiraceae bacterium]
MQKKLLSIFTATALALSVVACGTTEKTAVATEDTSTAAESEAVAEGFPMTITHGLGETVIEKKPENVVAIAWGNPDVPLALGVVPVGISEANFGPRDENGLLQWTAEAFEKLGATPNVFKDTDGWDYEAIADCNPDVILAAYSGLSQDEYDRLSEIAPVVAY